ncbi:pilus assembly protein PilX [Geomonas paludis]|uniref:Pilus assembly protein PilX n=1 Tax=Geomonas paludis TaxID=2740185 RepID=A0A6V8MVK5_9BACT|nr:pilus assembly protein PilX [Geomonas paludis]UPU37565.1 pilus assembly protein PilX [Geomonas paludis]GFO63904.1 type IV pilus minor pilin PilX [Geomonas paludis]
MAAPCSEKGAALITALMLTTLSLVIAMALLSTIIAGTQVAASQKRYRSALTSAHGGLDLFTSEILPRLFQTGYGSSDFQRDFAGIDLKVTLDPCLQQKLTLRRAEWSACNEAQAGPDPAQAPETSFRLAGEPPTAGFNVSTKIIDTVPGNTDRSGYYLLDSGGAVAAQDDVIRPQHVPAMYNIYVQGTREEVGSREKARLSVLYAY